MQITLDVLRRFAGKGAHEDILRAIADAAPLVLPKYGITSPRRMQQFFANIAVESGGFTTIREENLNYKSTARLREVWPSRFKTDAAAAPFVRNPELLANTVYANRMGNGPAASGDGFRFRGRGLPQLTGREAYEAIGRIMGRPSLATNPGLICELPHILEAAAAFWKWKGAAIVNAAEAGQTRAVRKLWNGGTVGLAEVTQWLTRAERVFTEALTTARPAALLDASIERAGDDEAHDDHEAPGRSAPPLDDLLADDGSAEASAAPIDPAPAVPSPATAEVPREVDLREVQNRLRALGYYGVGNPDGDFAGLTRGAIVAFKHDNGLLPETPDVDQMFLAQLAIAKPRAISAARASATSADLAQKNPTVWAIAKDKLVKLIAGAGAGLTALASYIGEKFRDTWESLAAVRDMLGAVPLWVWLGLAAGILLVGYEFSRRAEKDTVDKYRRGELL